MIPLSVRPIVVETNAWRRLCHAHGVIRSKLKDMGGPIRTVSCPGLSGSEPIKAFPPVSEMDRNTSYLGTLSILLRPLPPPRAFGRRKNNGKPNRLPEPTTGNTPGDLPLLHPTEPPHPLPW